MRLQPKFLQISILAILGVSVIGALSLGSNQHLQGQTGSECYKTVPKGGKCNTSAGEMPAPDFNYDQNGACAADGGCGCYTSAVCDCGNGINGLCFAGACSSCENTGGAGGTTADDGGDQDPCANIDCNDNNACTTDSCTNGQCSNVPKSCDDGNACTTDSCNAQSGECSNTPKSCDDGDACTTDSCDEQSGACKNDLKDCSSLDSACADGVCSGGSCYAVKKDSCNTVPPGGGNFSGESGGTPPGPPCTGIGDCDDGDDCTLDYCGAMGCFYTPNIGDARCPFGGGGDSGDSEDNGETDGDPPQSSASSSAYSSANSSANSSASTSLSCRQDCAEGCRDRARRCQESCNDQYCPGWRDPDFTGPCEDEYNTAACGNQCSIAENSCQDRCDDKCRPTPTASQASVASSNNNSAENTCEEGETLCVTDMQIMCACNGVATDYTCPAGSCFSCPTCPEAASSASSARSDSSASLISFCDAFQETYCFQFKYQLLDAGIDINIPLNCLYQQYCLACNPYKQSCVQTCVTPLCGPDGFFMRADTKTCTDNECKTPPSPGTCNNDSDCGEGSCKGCGYNKEQQMCTKECEEQLCINGQCRKTIPTPISCNEECEASKCDQSKAPDCDDSDFAFCCGNGSWECVPKSIDPDFAEEFLCPNNDECPLGTSCVPSGECSGLNTGSCSNGVCCFSANSSKSSTISIGTSSRKQSSLQTSASLSISSSSSLSLTLSSRQTSPSSSSSSSNQNISIALSSSSFSFITSSTKSQVASSQILSSVKAPTLSLASESSSTLNANSSSLQSDPGNRANEEDDDGNGDNDDGIRNNQLDDDDDGIRNNQPNDDNGDGDNDDGIPGNNRNTLVASANICGNGVLELGEECDDSNRRDNDGCSAGCKLEVGVCGDGVVQTLLGEQCERSTHDTSLPYSCERCRFVSPTCGNGTIEPGEECDNGAQNSNEPNANCRESCHLGICGDGILDNSELCDDGNRVSGDGCDRYCRNEDKQTQVAGQKIQFSSTPKTGLLPNAIRGQQQVNFPQFTSNAILPYQLPLAQLQPLVQGQAPVGDTGPAAVAVIGAGAAAGWSFMRKKK